MKLIINSSLTLFLFIFLACGPSQKTLELINKSKQLIGTIPTAMPGSQNDSKDLIELGKKLFFEKKLSDNNTISCNSCHTLNNNGPGVDNKPTSPGSHGKKGDRNSPSVLNAGYHLAQFWDGRAKDLKEQAKGPILNPIEMAMPSEKKVIKKLKKIKEYKKLFAKAYPQQKKSITYDNLANAIAAFERTLRTYDRFDDFMKGNHKALTQEEQKGLDLFITVGCTACHAGPLLGGHLYQKLGLVNPYKNTKDLGRYNITKKVQDKFYFKVPSLRNIANTAPYFHDGAVATLEEAVKQMAWLQLGKKLDDQSVDHLVSFLKSLSNKTKN